MTQCLRKFLFGSQHYRSTAEIHAQSGTLITSLPESPSWRPSGTSGIREATPSQVSLGVTLCNFEEHVTLCFKNHDVCIPGQALIHALENNLKVEAGARPNTPRFLLLLTDGKSQDDAIAAANRLKNSGVEIIAIGEMLIATQWVKISLMDVNMVSLQIFIICQQNVSES